MIFNKIIPVLTIDGKIFLIQLNQNSLNNLFIFKLEINKLNDSKKYYLLNYITQNFDVQRKSPKQNIAFVFFSN